MGCAGVQALMRVRRFAYYNENDPKAAAWLRELIREGLITDGEVDERSIEDVEPADVMGFARCHWFAGIGGWDLALQLAGYERWDVTTWTGSCPCQPFSAAGKRGGTDDKRHLWPEFYRLIAESQPATVFGEQVASRLGREWLAGVFDDLEAVGYAVAGADLCAAGVSAPHIRQRLYWVADSDRERRNGEHALLREGQEDSAEAAGCGDDSWVGNIEGSECNPWAASLDCWIPCEEGKARRIEPGIEPVADGVPERVVRIRGYGNAIVPQLAAKFIQASVNL